MKLEIPKSGTHTIRPSATGWIMESGLPDFDSLARPNPITSQDGTSFEVVGTVWTEPKNPKKAGVTLVKDIQLMKNIQSAINNAIFTLLADGQFLFEVKICNFDGNVRIDFTSSDLDGTLPNPLDSKGEGGTIA